jgi:hypothetical protein
MAIGAWLLIAGLYKLNDPVGFSIYLQEVFLSENMALFWSSYPSWIAGFYFNFAKMAMGLSLFYAVIEVLIGLSLLFKWVYKWAVFLSTLVIVFTFLTTLFYINQDAQEIRIQAATEIAQVITEELEFTEDNSSSGALEDSTILIPFSSEIADNEPFCCPCTDAYSSRFFTPQLTGKVAFSILGTLLFLVVILLLTILGNYKNSSRENTIFAAVTWCIALVFAIYTPWYWLIFVSFLLMYLSLNLKRSRITLLKTEWFALIFAALLLFLFGTYNSSFEPLSDMSCYAEGMDLNKSTSIDAYPSQERFIYYNTENGAEVLCTIEQHQQISVAVDTNYIFARILDITLPSGKSFDPILRIKEHAHLDLSKFHFEDLLVQHKTSMMQFQNASSDLLQFFAANNVPELYKKDTNWVSQKVMVFDPLKTELYLGKALLESELVFIWSIKEASALKEIEWQNMNEMSNLLLADSIQSVVIGSVSSNEWFKREGAVVRELMYLELAEEELNKMGRTYGTLIILKNGVIYNKYPLRALPKYETIVSKLKI